MENGVNEKLIALKQLVAEGSKSEIPEWLLFQIEENVSKMLSGDASNKAVSSKLIGGLRAIYDSSSPADDDPVIFLINQIVKETDSSVA